MLSSDDEIAGDEESTLNKVAGTVETKIADIQDKGLSRNGLITLESQLMGE